LVAADVKYGVERLQDQTCVFAPLRRDPVVDVIDPSTVKMSFAKPFPGIFRMLAQFKGGEIVAKEAVEPSARLLRRTRQAPSR